MSSLRHSSTHKFETCLLISSSLTQNLDLATTESKYVHSYLTFQKFKAPQKQLVIGCIILLSYHCYVILTIPTQDTGLV